MEDENDSIDEQDYQLQLSRVFNNYTLIIVTLDITLTYPFLLPSLLSFPRLSSYSFLLALPHPLYGHGILDQIKCTITDDRSNT